MALISAARAASFSRLGSAAPGGDPGDRGGVGLQGEQAGAELVVQFERGAAALVVLRGQQLPIEPTVGGADLAQRFRDLVEPVGDHRQLPGAGGLQARGVIVVLQLGQAVAEPRAAAPGCARGRGRARSASRR